MSAVMDGPTQRPQRQPVVVEAPAPDTWRHIGDVARAVIEKNDQFEGSDRED